MCPICKTCEKNTVCYCTRCPMNSNRITMCPVCATDNCVDDICASVARTDLLTEHYESTHEIYCQICVETKYKFSMYQQFAMYCNEHEMEHKHRMRLTLRLPEDYDDASGAYISGAKVNTEEDLEEDLEELEKESEKELSDWVSKAEQLEFYMEKLADVSAAQLARNAAAKIREYISQHT
jgi:hypothetical protein